MALTDILKGRVALVGLALVIGFCIWKFLIQPRMNEGLPIEPEEKKEEESFIKPLDF